MVELLNEAAMAAAIRGVLGYEKPKSQRVENERTRGFFGAPLSVITELWGRLVPLVALPGAHPKHLLWALVFLKVYSTTAVHCRLVGWVDEKTFRKWSWYFLSLIASLKDDVIQLDNRFEGYDGKAICLISVDGVDCMVDEPWPFDKGMYVFTKAQWSRCQIRSRRLYQDWSYRLDERTIQGWQRRLGYLHRGIS